MEQSSESWKEAPYRRMWQRGMGSSFASGPGPPHNFPPAPPHILAKFITQTRYRRGWPVEMSAVKAAGSFCSQDMGTPPQWAL